MYKEERIGKRGQVGKEDIDKRTRMPNKLRIHIAIIYLLRKNKESLISNTGARGRGKEERIGKRGQGNGMYLVRERAYACVGY